MIFKRVESILHKNLFWQHKEDVTFKKDHSASQFHMTIDPSRSYQTHIGFGAAFTESASYTWSKMPKNIKDQIIKDYFSQEGLGYTMGRTHINSCDFSLGNYDYVIPFDTKLESFDLSREELYVIPMIKEAMTYVSNLKLLASPWSPPYWMKSNQMMNHGGKLLPEYREVWAKYYVKYVDEMKKRGIPYWAISVQNEPAANQTWDSCLYTAEEERDFVKDYLGPTVQAYDKDLKILGWDHNRDIMVERARTLLEDKEASAYFWGIAHHWYVSEAFENVSKVHELFPDKHAIFTEGCIEGGPKPGAWDTGLRYARNIMGDLNNHVEGWIEWNLVLDMEGGPNHVGNFCDAPVLADPKSKTYLKNSSYYAIGHFSKYIKEGAKRLHHEGDLPDFVQAISYLNPDGRYVIVLLNESSEIHDLNIKINGQSATIKIQPRGLISLIGQ
ncbi:MAG: glycoside hydrolase family 30 protein [Acholeplasmataceae bacterium]|jgi:glucosylceramidase|nr:glycoside hydrolase family 30 protein [Acholeplasmataceae bacterium]